MFSQEIFSGMLNMYLCTCSTYIIMWMICIHTAVPHLFTYFLLHIWIERYTSGMRNDNNKKKTSNIDTQTSIIDTRRQDNINHWDLKYNFNLCLQLSIRSNEQITKIGRKFLSIIDWNKSDSGLWSKSDLTTGRDNRRGQVSVSTTSLVRQKFG